MIGAIEYVGGPYCGDTDMLDLSMSGWDGGITRLAVPTVGVFVPHQYHLRDLELDDLVDGAVVKADYRGVGEAFGPRVAEWRERQR